MSSSNEAGDESDTEVPTIMQTLGAQNWAQIWAHILDSQIGARAGIQMRSKVQQVTPRGGWKGGGTVIPSSLQDLGQAPEPSLHTPLFFVVAH